MSDTDMAQGAGQADDALIPQADAAPPLRRRKPLWRRVLVGVLQAGVAIGVAIHVYGLALAVLPVPATILMAQRALEGEDVRREWVSLDAVPVHLVHAVIAAEDTTFCSHGGINWEAIEKAREYNRKHKGEKRRGGSTITQQTVKNVFFWNGGGMARKAGEAWLSLGVERVWGKRRIMEVYLNVAEWGDGLFGVQAAAKARFGKDSKDLTPQEAALLAAVLPSPNKWRVDPPGPYVRERAGTIRARMRVVEADGLADCVTGTTK